MSEVLPSVQAYRFGPFRLDVSSRILERNGERIQLTPKVIDTLFVLIGNRRQVVTKEALMKAVWPDVTVVESGLTRNMSSLRKALEDGSEEGSFIETVPRRGYRFVAEVTEELLVSQEEPVPMEVPVAAPRISRFALRAGLTLAALASVAGLAMVFRPQPATTRVAVEPSVRIGEHLLYKLAPDETVRAAEHFERAIANNPGSASAHAGLSISLLSLSMLGVRSMQDVLPQALTAAKKSLQLDARSSAAHYAMGSVHLVSEWDFSRADAEFRKALALQPESVQSRLGYARLKLTTGDFLGAQQLVEEALRLDPASPPLGTEYCRVFYYQRDFQRAESECRKVLDREPGYGLAYYYLALSLGSLGRLPEARQNLKRSSLMPGVLEADYAWLSLREGDRRPALAVLEQRRELVRQGKVGAIAKLLPAAILNRMDEAYEALEAGVATKAPEFLTVAIEPRLDPIRSDARYAPLLRRAGIPSAKR
ncbi:MAG: winged helix-turn-helix domain-containing protein [Bryobacteraceae bacterium]|nr:winged helix-turn-helix domain-containing protein [Bryobacteraceae bacterium]